TRTTDANMARPRPLASRRPALRFLHDVPAIPGARKMKPIQHAPRLRHLVLVPAFALVLPAMPALAETMAALVHQARVEVHAAPDFGSPSVATLERNAQLQVAGQQGLWFRVATADGKEGFVRVNDVRMAYAGKEGGEANVRALFTGQAGKGRVTETAGVRGLDESNLQSASLDQ